MKKASLSVLILLITIALNAQKQCVIRGEVINRESKVLLLHRYSEGYRSFRENPTKIFIKKGRFDYSFSYTEEEAYELIFEDEFDGGSWRSVTFFLTNGTIEFLLYPLTEGEKNKISGGQWNTEFAIFSSANENVFGERRVALMKLQADLQRSGNYDSPAFREVMRQIKVASTDEEKVSLYQRAAELEKTYGRYTESAKQLFVNPYDSLSRAELVWKYSYIRSEPSVFAYYLIFSDVEMQMKNNPQVAQLVTSVFPLYQKKYPDHIYTKKIATQLAGLKTIDVGNKYIDIKAPSVDGDTLQLSAIIENHVALIDLWGSWCGPCIAKSRLVVPIYKHFSPKGFRIVGVAREFKSTDAVKRRLAKEEFSWTNLVELDDKQNIWSTYGISNGTGLMVLVDKDGTILSIDPKPEELERILSQKLN